MSLLSKLCQKVGSKLPTWTIPGEDGSPYLSRHFIFRRSWLPDRFPFNKLPSLYLHYFHRGDNDIELHSHPWYHSISLILTGGYHEERRVGDQVHSFMYKPGSINVLRHNDYHRVELLKPQEGCWTLFLAGFGGRLPNDDWNFWHPQTGEVTPWRRFIARRDTKRSPESWMTKQDVENIIQKSKLFPNFPETVGRIPSDIVAKMKGWPS